MAVFEGRSQAIVSVEQDAFPDNQGVPATSRSNVGFKLAALFHRQGSDKTLELGIDLWGNWVVAAGDGGRDWRHTRRSTETVAMFTRCARQITSATLLTPPFRNAVRTRIIE